MLFRSIDPATSAADGGPSIKERINRHLLEHSRTLFHNADNKRVAQGGRMGGWDQVRARLKGDQAGPQIMFFETCVHTIRTLPLMQHDEARPEDTALAEDHAADECRYACMSRPFLRDAPKEPGAPQQPATIGEFIHYADEVTARSTGGRRI